MPIAGSRDPGSLDSVRKPTSRESEDRPRYDRPCDKGSIRREVWEHVRCFVAEANPSDICGDGGSRDSRDYRCKADCPQQYFKCKKRTAKRDVVNSSQTRASTASDHNTALFRRHARASR